MEALRKINDAGRMVPFVAARKLAPGMAFTAIKIGRTTTKFGERVFVDVEFEGAIQRLVLPERYCSLASDVTEQLQAEIDKNRPPQIKIVKRLGEGFLYDFEEFK